MAYWFEVLKLTSWVGQNQRGDCSKVVLVAVEAVPAGSKPPVAVGVRISKGERHDFGAAAPLPTRASSLEQGRAGGRVESSPKTAIPVLRLNYYSALHTLVSLGV